MISITEFYKDQEILITGGAGFLGKVLIEKLLRSCPDIKRIFVLIRSKKGKSASDRLVDNIINTPLFDILKSQNVSALNKLSAIEGDVTEINLGLKMDDLVLLKNVSIIFHVAASVRFDDPLRDAILINTRGTREIMKISEGLSKIRVIVHVSTTYCNPYQSIVEEKIYPPLADWKDIIKIAENYDTEFLNILSEKISTFQPNAYTFTKSLAEQVILEYKSKLPVVIFRPSIVISSVNDPFPGWIDNFNGPAGLLVGSGIGILRTMHGDPDVVSDFIPVDVAIKGLIITACKRGTVDLKSSELVVYNCSSSSLRSITTGQIIELGKQIVQHVPFEKMLWVPGGSITKCRVFNYIRLVLFHILVAYVVDMHAIFTKQRPFMMKLQRRIRAANLALHYFANTNWKFINNNFMALEQEVQLINYRDFCYLQFKDTDLEIYTLNALKIVRRYMLKQSDDSIPRSKIIYRRIYILDKVLKIIFLMFCFYMVFFYFKLWYFLKTL